jgi:small conductance mechanosensitive channel
MDIHIIYNKVFNWLLSNGPKLIFGAIVFFAGLWVIRLIRSSLKKRMSQRQVHSSLQPFFLSLTITSLYFLLIIFVMEIVGIELTIFTTVIGAATVAAGLALSGTLQNFAGGILILLLKPFDLDDNIIAQGQDGVVTSIQIFYTVVLTGDNKTVIIPNGKLFNEVIVNVTREGKRRLDFEIKLGYAADSEQVKQIIQEAIKAMPNVLKTPASNVGIVSLEIDGIKYVVQVWVNPKDFLRTKIDLQERIVKDLRAAGVKLPGM